MNALFGISMDTIALVILGLFLFMTVVVAGLALRNRLFLVLGLRNIPRRRAQTVLIVVGLMLSARRSGRDLRAADDQGTGDRRTAEHSPGGDQRLHRADGQAGRADLRRPGG